MSSIVTFYSYKGGVGRSMALANIAVLLAQRGLKVLAVDWDLEAPGLERYFSYFDDKPGGTGLLRMFMEARDGRPANYATFTTSLDCHAAYPITLLASGREHDEAYSRNLEAFDWDGFFAGQGGAFLEDLRQRWREDFDIVLIDSRTGLSDTGGICTIQIPDVVVAMFTANYQSLYGVRDVMRLAQKARQTLAYDRMTLSVLPLPTRWGVQEFQETQHWLDRVTDAMEEFFDWLPRTLTAREVVEVVKVPQSDYFSFGEKLAVVEQGTSDPLGMGFVYDKVAAFLASDFKDVSALVGTGAASKPGSNAQPVTAAADSSGRVDYLYDIFVSHDRTMPEFVLDFVDQLKRELSALRGNGTRIFVDLGEVRSSDHWDEENEEALLRSKLLLAIVTRRYARRPLSAREFLTFAARSRQTGTRLVVPVVVSGEDFPSWLKEFQWLDLRRIAAPKGLPGRQPAGWQREVLRVVDVLNGMIAEAPPYDPKWVVAAPPKATSDITLWPVDLNLVTEDRQEHPHVGPTVNMMCRLSNGTTHAIELKRLELVVTPLRDSVFRLARYIFYNAYGGEHARVSPAAPITIAAGSVWEQGVQFRDSRSDIPNLWPDGNYRFDMLGWADRDPNGEPNLKTAFQANVPPHIAQQIREWSVAEPKAWDDLRATDRAVGFPLLLSDIRMA